MQDIRRLIVATDLSSAARRAVDRAALLAQQTGAALTLVHVHTLSTLERLRQFIQDLPASVAEREASEARAALDALAAAVMQRHGVQADTVLRSGALVDELKSAADESQADMVVLGAKGASFMRHLALGSTADRMIHTATRPMLVAKRSGHETYRTVLVPVDFSPVSETVLRLAAQVAPGAELILFHAFDTSYEGKLRLAGVDDATVMRYQQAARDAAQRRMDELCERVGLPTTRIRPLIVPGDAAYAILEKEQEEDCDLIAIGKHGEGRVAEFLLGSVARHVMSASQCDVLLAV